MKKILLVLSLLILTAGCHHNDLMVSPVIKGQPAPHDGWNVGPDLWVSQGQPCPITGAVIYLKGADPNSIFGE